MQELEAFRTPRSNRDGGGSGPEQQCEDEGRRSAIRSIVRDPSLALYGLGSPASTLKEGPEIPIVPKSYAAGLEMCRPGGACVGLRREIPSRQLNYKYRANLVQGD